MDDEPRGTFWTTFWLGVILSLLFIGAMIWVSEDMQADCQAHLGSDYRFDPRDGDDPCY